MATVEREFQYEHGWPDNTPEQQAIQDTLDAAAAHCAEMGATMRLDPPPTVTRYATEAHVEAGEYIIKVEGVRLHDT